MYAARYMKGDLERWYASSRQPLANLWKLYILLSVRYLCRQMAHISDLSLSVRITRSMPTILYKVLLYVALERLYTQQGIFGACVALMSLNEEIEYFLPLSAYCELRYTCVAGKH